jgi:outer membrane immunogenic protein
VVEKVQVGWHHDPAVWCISATDVKKSLFSPERGNPLIAADIWTGQFEPTVERRKAIMRRVSAVAIAALLGLAACQAASAADLPRSGPRAPAVYAPVPVSSWTGCYIGGNAGAGWGSAELSTSVGTISGSSDSARFVGGGQIGCDWQTGAWVFGIRNMFDWADAERSGTVGSGAFTGYSAKLENDWLDLLTGRIGFAVQPNWLLYFQGGAAWRKNSLTAYNPAGVEVVNTSRTRTGWTIGVGSEYKFAPNWSVFVEYNHAEFGSTNGGFNSPVLGPIAFSGKSDVDVVLFGLNWRPGGWGY